MKNKKKLPKKIQIRNQSVHKKEITSLMSCKLKTLLDNCCSVTSKSHYLRFSVWWVCNSHASIKIPYYDPQFVDFTGKVIGAFVDRCYSFSLPLLCFYVRWEL